MIFQFPFKFALILAGIINGFPDWRENHDFIQQVKIKNIYYYSLFFLIIALLIHY